MLSPKNSSIPCFSNSRWRNIALEPQAFTVDLPHSLQTLINAHSSSHLDYELLPIAKRLVAALSSLGEYPYIRYYAPPTRNSLSVTALSGSNGGALSARFAKMVQEELDELARLDKSFPPASSHPRAVLVVVDRGVDVAAPILHEFTYQAMVHDLLPLEEGNKIKSRFENCLFDCLLISDDFFFLGLKMINWLLWMTKILYG